MLDAKGDVLAFNELGVALLGDLSTVPRRERNLAWRRFLGGPSRVSHTPEQDEVTAAQTVADLRATAARCPHDPGLRSLLVELRRHSERFAQLWDAHIVEQRRSSTKTIDHPTVGTIELDCDVLHLPDTEAAGGEPREGPASRRNPWPFCRP